MPLPDLPPGHLAVLAFGPGIGELVLVRVPPGSWLVLDGCGAGDTDYAAAALEHYGMARPSAIVLTHPHDDHCRGLAGLIEASTPPDRKETWPRIGMVLPPGSDVAGRSGGFIAGATLQAIAAIESRWSASPACRWNVNAGDAEPLGDARLRVLSPQADVRADQLARWQAGRSFNKNIVSTALLLEWRGRRVVLGSDLVETPAHGWSHSLLLDPDLGDHDYLKVPHHGSDEALHDDLLRTGGRVLDPLRVLTPYSPGRLPKFAAGLGAGRIVSLGGTTYLTGLPRSHRAQSGQPERRALAELASHGDITFRPTTSGFPDCYVLVSIPPGGGAPVVTQGPGSMQVVP